MEVFLVFENIKYFVTVKGYSDVNQLYNFGLEDGKLFELGYLINQVG